MAKTCFSPSRVTSFSWSICEHSGSDEEEREQLEMILREHETQGASDICNALLDYAIEQDEHLRQIGDGSLIDDKTVFIIKRLETSSS